MSLSVKPQQRNQAAGSGPRGCLLICGKKGFRGHFLAGINMSIMGLPGREGRKERKRIWGHGRSLPSPLPTAAEMEDGGEPALETPSVWRAPWSPRASPAEHPGAHSTSPDSNPAASPQGTVHPPGHRPRQTHLSQHGPEHHVPQPPGEDLSRLAEREAL